MRVEKGAKGVLAQLALCSRNVPVVTAVRWAHRVVELVPLILAS